MIRITWDSLEEDSLKDNSQLEDNPEPEMVVDSQLGAGQIDLYVTSAETGALPSLMVVQTYHLSCPSLPCVVSTIFHHDINQKSTQQYMKTS